MEGGKEGRSERLKVWPNFASQQQQQQLRWRRFNPFEAPRDKAPLPPRLPSAPSPTLCPLPPSPTLCPLASPLPPSPTLCPLPPLLPSAPSPTLCPLSYPLPSPTLSYPRPPPRPPSAHLTQHPPPSYSHPPSLCSAERWFHLFHQRTTLARAGGWSRDDVAPLRTRRQEASFPG